MALSATIALEQGTSTVPANRNIPMRLTIANASGAPITLQSIRLLVDFPADSVFPVAPVAICNILAQNIVVPAGGSSFIGANAVLFGIEVGTYTIDAEIIAAGEALRCASPLSITLI